MQISTYETIDFNKYKLPVVFHTDSVTKHTKFDPHWHEALELLFFLDGEGEVRLNEHTFTVKRGDIVIINPNDLHTIISISDEITYHCIIIDKGYSDSLGFNTDNLNFQRVVHNTELFHFGESIFDEAKNDESYCNEAIKILSSQILLLLFRHYQENETAFSHAGMGMTISKAVISYVRSNYMHNISIDTIASTVGYSKYHLSRVFAKIVGMTINTYVTDFRLHKAEQYLRETEKSITEVAELCGFADLSYFGKVFKKRNDISPLQYKRDNINNK